MDAKKVAIMGLILIVLLFAGAVWLGASRNDSASQPASPGWTKSLQNVFGGKERAISSGEIQAPCFRAGSFRIAMGGSCEAQITESSARTRSLRLALAGVKPDRPGSERPAKFGPRKVEVEMKSKGQASVPVRIPLDSKNDTTPKLQILDKGATLTFQCKQSVSLSCEVELM